MGCVSSNDSNTEGATNNSSKAENKDKKIDEYSAIIKRNEIEEMFVLIDKDHNGYVDRQEFADAIESHEFGKKIKKWCKEQNRPLDYLFQQADKNMDNQIHLNELIKLLTTGLENHNKQATMKDLNVDA